MPRKLAPITFRYLLGDDYFPITSTIGFWKTKDWNLAAEKLRKIQNRFNAKTSSTPVSGDLETALQSILPMYAYATKFLVVPTTGDWTALFTNTYVARETIEEVDRVAYEALKCTGVTICGIPDTRLGDPRDSKGRQYHTSINITDPKLGQPPCYELRRVVACDSSLFVVNWFFKEEGTVQPFEKPEHYTAKKKKDRFTPELLNEYLRAMDIRAFDDDFYMPDGKAIVIEAIMKDTRYGEPKSLEVFQVEKETFSPYAVRKNSKGE